MPHEPEMEGSIPDAESSPRERGGPRLGGIHAFLVVLCLCQIVCTVALGALAWRLYQGEIPVQGPSPAPAQEAGSAAGLDALLRHVEDLSALKSELSRQQEDNARLQKALADEQDASEKLRTELRRQKITMDRERTEFKETFRVMEDAMEKRKEAEAAAEPGNSAETKNDVQGARSAQGTTGDLGLLADLNRFLSGYRDAGIQISECEGIEDGCLKAPVVHAAQFLDHGASVLMPDRLLFQVQEGALVLTCQGGRFSCGADPNGSLPEGGIPLARLPLLEPEPLLTPSLQRFLGIFQPGTPDQPMSQTGGANPSDARWVMKRLNELLENEKRGQYRFQSLGSVDGKTLAGVELEQNESPDVLKSTVKAERCEIHLIREHKYVEFIFKDGYLIRNNEAQPFYNDQYRLPIPNIDPEQWEGAGLDCITVE